MDIILSNGETVKVPEGANPAAYRKYREGCLRVAANPRKRRPNRSIKPSRKINYAQLVVERGVF